MPNQTRAHQTSDTDLMQPLDLSHLCDGQRTDFPLGIEVETANVMLNGAYLQLDDDYIVGRKQGQSIIELRRAPRAGDSVVVLRAPASDGRAEQRRHASAIQDVPPYENLPQLVKDNFSAEQWLAASRGIINEGATIPESTDYINLKNGQIHTLQVGEPAPAPLLPAHDLSGGGGADDAQFHTAPAAAPNRRSTREMS